MFDFVNFSWIDVLDIILVAILIYQVFKLIRGTSALRIFTAILLLYVMWIVVRAFNMKLLSSIMGQVLGVGVIALIVIFQPEIRRFLLHIGNSYSSHSERRFVAKFRSMFGDRRTSIISDAALEEITGACRRMSETKTGALIVFKHSSSLDMFVQTGDTINADINRRLIENIFFKNTPLHDGAVIATPQKILAARCTLPISQNPNINPRYGMRHRAALGISEDTDAEVVVVSEETGEISYVANGEIKTMTSLTELRLALENSYKQ
ncbi:MAG: TIGR00159 family protein [Bacteroidales bacterium]|nr:TIGR00159 family protein [Bacteroidales bacterium]